MVSKFKGDHRSIAPIKCTQVKNDQGRRQAAAQQKGLVV